MSMQTVWPYQTLGDQGLPPLVFLHGFMGSGLDWLPVARRCAGRFYCVLPDLPGHGRNIGPPLTTTLDFDTVVGGLKRLTEQIGLEQVNLIGYSMGGRLALYLAMQYPDLIRTLVLEGANPGIQADDDRRVRAKLDDRRAVSLLHHGVGAFVESWYELPLFASLHQRPALLEEVKLRRKQNNPHWLAKVIRELSPGRQPSLWQRLGSLSPPCLLVTGALDPKYVEIASQMAGLIPRATVAFVPAAGHNVHLERPGRFAKLILGFIDDEV